MNSRRALLLAALSCLACADKARGPEPLLLGEVGALSGAEASFGLSTRDGIALAVEEANADGGVRGRPVQLRVYDSQSRPEEAASAARRLIAQDKVLAILGEAASSSSLAMAPVAQAARVPMVTPTSTNPQVTEVGDYIFRACFLDEAQGGAMARYARMTLGLERVALLTEVTSAYSEGLTQVFVTRFEALGGQIVARGNVCAQMNSHQTGVRRYGVGHRVSGAFAQVYRFALQQGQSGFAIFRRVTGSKGSLMQ